MIKSIWGLTFILWLSVLVWSQSYLDTERSKYAQELDCEDSLTYDVPKYLRGADAELDLEKYKSVIRNGDIGFLEVQTPDDLQLGVLNAEELKLLRNLFYAAKGYIFSDRNLEDYFSRFAWYKPESKDVTFTKLKRIAIERIQEFENGSDTEYIYEDFNVVWKEFNGGANQRPCILALNADGTFSYEPDGAKNRVRKITGTWNIENNKIALFAEKEYALFGGFFLDGPVPYLTDGSNVTITYETPIKILLPIKNAAAVFGQDTEWLKIGSRLFYTDLLR